MTPQTRRRKFIAEARKKAYHDGRRETENQFYAWFRQAVKLAKKGKWGMLEAGPEFHKKITIQCSADISALFTRAQHDLSAEFADIDGFAARVIARGKEKLKNETF